MDTEQTAAWTSVIRHRLLLRAVFDKETLDTHFGEIYHTLGLNLAMQVDRHIQETKLGYYPPLDFFAGSDAVDARLLEMTHHISAMVVDLFKRELRRHLQPIFASIEIRNPQVLAYSMPRIRPRQKYAVEALAAHFSPDQVQLELLGHELKPSGPSPAGKDDIPDRVIKALAPHFLEIIPLEHTVL
jgi:hypothetical protein